MRVSWLIRLEGSQIVLALLQAVTVCTTTIMTQNQLGSQPGLDTQLQPCCEVSYSLLIPQCDASMLAVAVKQCTLAQPMIMSIKKAESIA